MDLLKMKNAFELAMPRVGFGVGLHNAQPLERVNQHLSSFQISLLESESRIRLYPLTGLVDAKKTFFLDKRNIYIAYSLPSLGHQIAHAVEMKDSSRWLLPDWGMNLKGFVHQEDQLTARMYYIAMAREIRVRAIQLHMEPFHRLNKKSTVYNICNNQHAWGSWAERFTPHRQFQNFQHVWNWVEYLREKTYREWSLDRIRHEWSLRLTHMQHWMEIQEKGVNYANFAASCNRNPAFCHST
jgi:hypothetical protein